MEIAKAETENGPAHFRNLIGKIGTFRCMALGQYRAEVCGFRPDGRVDIFVQCGGDPLYLSRIEIGTGRGEIELPDGGGKNDEAADKNRDRH